MSDKEIALDEMTLAQLKEVADASGVAYKNNVTKAALLETLKALDSAPEDEQKEDGAEGSEEGAEDADGAKSDELDGSEDGAAADEGAATEDQSGIGADEVPGMIPLETQGNYSLFQVGEEFQIIRKDGVVIHTAPDRSSATNVLFNLNRKF